MRICFIDFAPWHYDVSTPFERPLGGSQSAMCYLAIELAKLGHDVFVVTQTGEAMREIMGVQCGGYLPARELDVLIAINAPGNGVALRSHIQAATKLILWTQHAANQPVMRTRLIAETHRDIWDKIVCVSNWQREEVLKEYELDPDRVCVLRNAIAPAFENLFTSHVDLVAAKSGDVLRLTYTSTPYRGLKLLPDIFKPYHAANPDAVLEVYSSMAVYMESMEEDRERFAAIYDAVSETEGMELVGSIPQPELAHRLRGAHILAYPNAFPETSCISVMEALAAGLRIVTSHLGALPETCEDFAYLVPIIIEIDDEATSINVKNGTSYTAAFQTALAKATYNTGGLYDQVKHMNTHHTWAIRAHEWLGMLDAA